MWFVPFARWFVGAEAYALLTGWSGYLLRMLKVEPIGACRIAEKSTDPVLFHLNTFYTATSIEFIENYKHNKDYRL